MTRWGVRRGGGGLGMAEDASKVVPNALEGYCNQRRAKSMTRQEGGRVGGSKGQGGGSGGGYGTKTGPE
jgi:hypothetical protein